MSHQVISKREQCRTSWIRDLFLVLRSHPRRYLCSPPASCSLCQINRTYIMPAFAGMKQYHSALLFFTPYKSGLWFCVIVHLRLLFYTAVFPNVSILRWHFFHFLYCGDARHVCLCRIHILVTFSVSCHGKRCTAKPRVYHKILAIASSQKLCRFSSAEQ